MQAALHELRQHTTTALLGCREAQRHEQYRLYRDQIMMYTHNGRNQVNDNTASANRGVCKYQSSGPGSPIWWSRNKYYTVHLDQLRIG